MDYGTYFGGFISRVQDNNWLIGLRQCQLAVVIQGLDSLIRAFPSVQHDVPAIGQTVWTSAYLTSIPGQYKWTSGEVVLYGLSNNIQGRPRIHLNANFIMSDQNGTRNFGYFCESGMYGSSGCLPYHWSHLYSTKANTNKAISHTRYVCFMIYMHIFVSDE